MQNLTDSSKNQNLSLWWRRGIVIILLLGICSTYMGNYRIVLQDFKTSDTRKSYGQCRFGGIHQD